MRPGLLTANNKKKKKKKKKNRVLLIKPKTEYQEKGKPKTVVTEDFECKNRKTDLKNNQNRKI